MPKDAKELIQLINRGNGLLYPKIISESIDDGSIGKEKLADDTLTFYDSIPLTKDIFNPIYRVNSNWVNDNFKNQGTIDTYLADNTSLYNVNEGVGLKVNADNTMKSVDIVSNLEIKLTPINYTKGMTYLNYCKMGSMPDDDVELTVSASMDERFDNRYHALVWEKTNLARADWKIDGSWSGDYYIDEQNGDAVQLTEEDLNKVYIVTADCADKIFILYTFDGTTVTRRGVVQLPTDFVWQSDYTNTTSYRRSIGIGRAIFGGEHKPAIFYEGMLWNKILTEDEITIVCNKLKYYRD